MAPVNYSSTGLSRNNGVGRTGSYHNRGALTKLAGTAAPSGSRVGVQTTVQVARNVPRPVNTSSLRKENGGQDLSIALVNRHGGKKVGWGSSLPEKKNERPPLSLDPTPEEALAATAKREASENEIDQLNHDPQLPQPPQVSSNKNTPWALHPPTQPREPVLAASTNSTNRHLDSERRNGTGTQSHDPKSKSFQDYPDLHQENENENHQRGMGYRSSSNGTYNRDRDYNHNQENSFRSYHSSERYSSRGPSPHDSSYNRRFMTESENSKDRQHYADRDYHHRDRIHQERDQRSYETHSRDEHGYGRGGYNRDRSSNGNMSHDQGRHDGRDHPPMDRYHRHDENRRRDNYRNNDSGNREIPEQRGQDTTEGTGRFHDFVRSERSTHNIAHGQGYDRSMRDEPNENGYRGSSRYDRRSRDDGYGTRYERYRTYDRPSRETGEINNLNSRQDGRDYKVSQTSCREELDHRSLSQEDNGKQQEGLGESNNPQSSPKLDTIVEPKTILRHEDINSITKQVSSPEVINEPLELNRVQTAESTSIPIVTCKVEGETVCERPALESDVVDSDDLLSVDASEDIDMSHDSSEVNSSSNSLEHDNIMVPSSHDAEEVLSELIPNKVSSNSDGEVQPSPNDNEMVDVDVEIQIAFEESSSEQQRQERAVQQQQLVLRHVEESRAKARSWSLSAEENKSKASQV